MRGALQAQPLFCEFGKAITTMGTLDTLAQFDWITTVIGAVKVVRGYRPISVYWSANPPAFYERVLRKKGIRTGAGAVLDQGFVILVPKERLAEARRILENAGAVLA